MVENPQTRTPYILELVGRSLGREGFEFVQRAVGVEDAKKSPTLLFRLAGVAAATIANFVFPSTFKAVINDQEFGWAVSADLMTNSIAVIAAISTGVHTRNVGLGIATFLASRIIFNAMTHISRDLLQQINSDRGF